MPEKKEPPFPPKTCIHCRWWVPDVTTTSRIGFCTWREENHKKVQPRMNRDSHYRLSCNGQILMTKSNAGCLQWQPVERNEKTK